MAEEKDLSRLNRLTKIIVLLQSKRIISSTDIANKFGVSKRTAYRDIRALEKSGIPVFTVEGQGYSLMEGYTLPPIMFTEEEANALITAATLVERNKDSSLILHHENAITKVKAVLRYSGKDKAELLSNRMAYMQNLQKDITSHSLSKIQLAITHFNFLTIEYHSISKEEHTRRKVEPLALYHARENWILIAYCHLRNAYREFRLDHIQYLVVEDTRFADRDFSLNAYFRSQYST